MLYTLIEFSASFLEIFYLLCTYGLFFEKRWHSKAHYIFTAFSCLVITFFITYLNNLVLYSYGTLAIWILITTATGLIFYKSNPIIICSISILYIVLISSFDSLFLVFVEYFLKSPNFVYAALNNRSIERVIALIVSKSTLSCAYWFITKVKRKITVNLTVSVFLIIFGILSFTSMQYLVSVFFTSQQRDIQTTILVAFAFMTLFFLSILLILNSNEKVKRKNNEKQIIESKLKNSEERNKKIIESYREIAKISHDHNNQLKVISQLLTDGKIKDATDYMSQIIINSVHKSTAYTGFNSIDAVLSEKYRISKENNVMINFDISIISIQGIAEIDICTILLNLLDNAIEACLKNNNPDSKIIKVVIKNINSMVFIKTENPVVYQDAQKNPSLIFTTSKKNKERHGLGLMIVNSIAEKYNGTLVTKNENGIFESSVLLNN